MSAFTGLVRRRILGIFITLTLSIMAFLAMRGEFGGGIALPLRVMIPSSILRGPLLVARAWEKACWYERQNLPLPYSAITEIFTEFCPGETEAKLLSEECSLGDERNPFCYLSAYTEMATMTGYNSQTAVLCSDCKQRREYLALNGQWHGRTAHGHILLAGRFHGVAKLVVDTQHEEVRGLQ